jgi:cytochrome P450
VTVQVQNRTDDGSGAGADSTASTMQSFFHFVLSNREIYQKLCKEIREAHLSNVTWAEAQELSYFQACLLETMRMRPAVGLSIPRYVPKGGAKIDGKYYPGGIVASVNGWAVHRDALYGDRVDKFRPDRWFGDVKEMKKHMYQVSAISSLKPI